MAESLSYSILEPCPYLPGKISSIRLSARSFSPALYESLLCQGWRRSGKVFYRYGCPGCSLCVPIRLSSSTLRLSGRFKRILSKNSDLIVRLVPPSDREEYFCLYEKYINIRHGSREQVDKSGFSSLLAYSSSALTEYRTAAGILIAIGFIDILPNGLSSTYFAFDPEYRDRSLGYLSVILEAKLARELGKPWYYLGFWVPGSEKMDYKADFSPFQIALPPRGEWIDADGREDALSLLARSPG